MGDRDLLERIFLCGLGVLAVAEERVEKVLEELEKKGKAKEKELGQRLRSVSESEPVSLLEKTFRGMLKRLDIPTASDIRMLRKEIDQLKELLRQQDEASSSEEKD